MNKKKKGLIGYEYTEEDLNAIRCSMSTEEKRVYKDGVDFGHRMC